MKTLRHVAVLGLVLAFCHWSGTAFASEKGETKSSNGGRTESSGNRESGGSREPNGAKETESRTESKTEGRDDHKKNSPGDDGSSGKGRTSASGKTKPSDPNADAALLLRHKISATPVLSNDAVKQAVTDGRAVSMTLLLTFLDKNQSGQVLDVKLHETGQGLAYEVKLLSNIVILRSVFLDAATLKPL